MVSMCALSLLEMNICAVKDHSERERGEERALERGRKDTYKTDRPKVNGR